MSWCTWEIASSFDHSIVFSNWNTQTMKSATLRMIVAKQITMKLPNNFKMIINLNKSHHFDEVRHRPTLRARHSNIPWIWPLPGISYRSASILHAGWVQCCQTEPSWWTENMVCQNNQVNYDLLLSDICVVDYFD